MTNLMTSARTFLAAEDGAVTVDWVVLTAALVGLGLAVMAVVSNGVENLSANISDALTSTNPLQDPFTANTADPVTGVLGTDSSLLPDDS